MLNCPIPSCVSIISCVFALTKVCPSPRLRQFHPIYNPKYVKLYQNRRLGPELPPHIFAIADTAYHCMLKERRNQCVVISGESGSGKTESTNFLLHHLTALSQKGSHGSGVEQTILSAGPVLEVGCHMAAKVLV